MQAAITITGAVRMPKLWVLEDDEDAINLYEKVFTTGYTTRYFKTLGELKSAASDRSQARPDLLIADLHLPDGEFSNFVEGNANSLDMPFAVVSANDDYTTLSALFKKGAKDFFVKPVNKNEILYKIERILSGKSNTDSSKQQFKDMTLDTFSQSVIRTGREKAIQLTQTEYKILALFFRNSDRRLNREEIISEVWRNEALSPKAFDFHLSKLREKLRDLGVKIHYQTNEGYCLTTD